MKHTILIIFFLIFLSCKQNKQTNSVSTLNEPDKEMANDLKKIEEIENEKKTRIKRWFEPTELDTTLRSKNSLTITLKNTDSIYISEYYVDKEIIDSLNRIHNNSHSVALGIENYLLKINTEFAKKDSLGLHLKMENSRWKLISVNQNEEEVDNTFEHYFQKFGFYSVRTQWGEGNSYKLINDKNGEVTNLFGRPYFSKNGEYLISVSVDIEAGYSRNGLQLFRNRQGELEKILDYEPKGWGPYSAKWKNKATVILKNETVEIRDGEMNYIDFYAKLEIENGG
jgi:hypothetical protein